MKNLLKILLSFFAFCLFTFAVVTPVNMVGNWYQQFMPNIGSRNITDVFFLDSLTGWAVTNATNQSNDTMFLVKTTNSGDNWFIHYRKLQTGGGFSGYFKVYFLNQNTGYASHTLGFDKTTNGGANWVSLNAPVTAYTDISVLNTDTIWLATPDSFGGGVFRTTNGGINWTQQLNLGSQNPNHIYMVNGSTGFIAEDFNYLRKTTNSGINWNVVSGADGFLDMYFVDVLTGWKCYGMMKKTTDGGNNWITQTLPSGGQLLSSGMGQFSVLNKDTIWGVGGQVQSGPSTIRGIIFRTTNGGDNWLFQLPDTAYGNFNYNYIQFTDRLHGWSYTPVKGVHTTTGGDALWLTDIKQISSEVPKDYILYQNYPNPFNPKTNIKYHISKNSFVSIKVYDITGREIALLVDQSQKPGIYETDLNGNNFPSGVYFYTLLIDNKVIDSKKMMLVK